MLGWLKEYHTEMLIWTGKENVTLAEHEEIIKCVASGDPDAAERSMIKHLDRSAALYVHQVRRRSGLERRPWADGPERPASARQFMLGDCPRVCPLSRDAIGGLDERERLQIVAPGRRRFAALAQAVDPMLLDRLDALLNIVPRPRRPGQQRRRNVLAIDAIAVRRPRVRSLGRAGRCPRCRRPRPASQETARRPAASHSCNRRSK